MAMRGQGGFQTRPYQAVVSLPFSTGMLCRWWYHATSETGWRRMVMAMREQGGFQTRPYQAVASPP